MRLVAEFQCVGEDLAALAFRVRDGKARDDAVFDEFPVLGFVEPDYGMLRVALGICIEVDGQIVDAAFVLLDEDAGATEYRPAVDAVNHFGFD